MSVDEPDDEIIRKKEFKRSFEIDLPGLNKNESEEVVEKNNENSCSCLGRGAFLGLRRFRYRDRREGTYVRLSRIWRGALLCFPSTGVSIGL